VQVLKLASVLLLYHLASDSLSGRAAYLATSTAFHALLNPSHLPRFVVHLPLESYFRYPITSKLTCCDCAALLSTLLKSSADLALRQPAASASAAMSLLGTKSKSKAKSTLPTRSEYRLVL